MLPQVEPRAEQIPFLSFLFLNGHLHSPIVLAVPASTGTLTRSACPMIHACGFAFSRTVIRSCAWDKHRRHGKGHGDHASSDPTLGSPVHSASKNKNGHCDLTLTVAAQDQLRKLSMPSASTRRFADTDSSTKSS